MAKIYTKRQLVADVAKATGLPQAQIVSVFEATASIQKKQLKSGYVVKTPNGQIKVVSRKARKGTNPRTGKIIQIPACKKPKFTFNVEFKKGF